MKADLYLALHASAPAGHKCADCTLDNQPCPTCYEAWWRKQHPNVHAATVTVISATNITDTDRINWLAARPLPAEVKGGRDDGHTAKFWGISAYSGTLREIIDHMIRTGSEKQKTIV